MSAAARSGASRLNAGRVRLAPSLATCAPAILVTVLALAPVWSATVRASWASLGRDQGIFQYIAWAVQNGEIAYRDVRDVNGPVVTLVHLVFMGAGGGEEHRFRVLDLVVTGATFAIAGAYVPSFLTASAGLLQSPEAQSPEAPPSRRSAMLVRVVWALAAWVALSAQYLAYGFWDTAQRESFLDWFVLVSIVLAASPSAGGAPTSRATIATLAAAGAASFIPWLGKPTFALFTASQIFALLIEAEPRAHRGRRLAWFLAGGALGLAGPLAFVALRGDLGRWARITFVDVPAMYRFIWPRPPGAILELPGYQATAFLALATSAGLSALIVTFRLSRRLIPIATMPVLGLVSVLVQAKGFPYHFHPATLGVSFGWLVALAVMGGSATTTARRAVVLLAALLVGGRAAQLGATAPYPAPPPPGQRDKASLESDDRLSHYRRIDFFPRALRDAAAYVVAHTKPDDRVQMYGMDPYLLFLAGRRSATPYIYAYDLNADAALNGSYDPGGLRPDVEQSSRIRAMRDEHASDLLRRLAEDPPRAFVFVDRSPLMSSLDAVEDFSTHCPEVAMWVAARYRQTAEFEGVRVWLHEGVTPEP